MKAGETGFDWRTSVGLVGGVAAKEIVVPVPGTAYSMREVDIPEAGRLPGIGM